jgi:hypothetical protein
VRKTGTEVLVGHDVEETLKGFVRRGNMHDKIGRTVPALMYFAAILEVSI